MPELENKNFNLAIISMLKDMKDNIFVRSGKTESLKL